MPRIDQAKIASALRQTESARDRRHAIHCFAKALRKEASFRPAWDAVGGAAGLASLMAEFSVRDVRCMCSLLGRSSSAEQARPDRRAALSELVRLLHEEPDDDRPLRRFYQNIVPACTLDVVLQWEEKREFDWTATQQKRLFFGHRERHETRFLEDIFSPDAKDLKLAKEKRLFRGNMAFCEEILSVLAAKEPGTKVRIPPDLIDELVMPMLKRLLKRRYDDETRNKFLHLVVQCVQTHRESLANQIDVFQRGLIPHAVLRWNEAAPGTETREETERYLVQLITLLPNKQWPRTLESIFQALHVNRKLDQEARYDFLKLLLQHMEGYKFDIEDESESGLARLKDLPVKNDLWPAKLFFSIDPKRSLRLFEKLDKVYPSGEFLAPASGGSRTVLTQTRGPDENRIGDVEVMRSLLLRKSKTMTEQEGSVWLSRTRTLVQDRRKNAKQAREPGDRAFWAKSALNLCVAAGDLDTLEDTVIWARHFNKDTLTTRDLYSADVFKTKELERLLGAMPEHNADTRATLAATVAPSSLKEDIEITNRIITHLLETAALTIQEPGFQRARWTSVLHLPRVMADRRLGFFKGVIKPSHSKDKDDDDMDRQAEIAEVVWKPTIDTLIEAETLLRRPTCEPLLGSANNISASGIYVFRKLSDNSMRPPLLAELARFLTDRMRARMGPEKMRMQVNETVDVVVRLARCDRPELACPFIRDLIIDGDGQDNISAWHRQLLSVRFLSELPARAAKELLHTMADAMREKLRKQNQKPRWWDIKKEAGDAADGSDPAATPNKPQQPAIKVTTVKMMAQLLQNNLFVDTSSSCEILIGLLSEARHVDIIITITGSLISTMEETTCPPQLRTRILDMLEKYVVPVAARLNERHNLTEEDWAAAAAAEDMAALPAVSEDTPLLGLLVEKARGAKLDPEDKARLARLIMNALEQSSVNNSRWIDLFLEKNNFSLDTDEQRRLRTSACPVNLKMLTSLFRDMKVYMPVSIFGKIVTMVLVNLDPPPGIARITTAVKANRDLVNSNAGKHWLAQFDNPGAEVFRLGLEDAALALQYPADEVKSKLADGEGITTQIIQSFVLAVAERLVDQGQTDILDTLVTWLCHRCLHGREEWQNWLANCTPLLGDVIKRVDSIRSRTSQEKQSQSSTEAPRKPPVRLPNTLRLRINMLPIPYASRDEPSLADEIDSFVSELSGLVDTLAQRRLPYHEDLAYLKGELEAAPREADFARFALKLHDVASLDEPSLADYLRLELAGEFLIEAEDPKDDTVASRARDMVRGLEGSHVEGLRAMGAKIAEKLASQGQSKWFRDG
ncbi:hypothetical protein ACJ41O_010007 [Fusarium nematophilum]